LGKNNLEESSKRLESHWPLIQNVLAILVVGILSILVAGMLPDYAGDFNAFYQAGAAILRGQSPYAVPGFYNPIWVALLFTPFALFSRELAYHIYAAIIFGASFYILWRLSQKRIGITLIAAFSPFFFMTMQYGNIDWLVLLGLLCPAELGIWLILVKPQMGAPLALLWAWKLYRERGLWKTLLFFLPVTLAYGLSFVIGMRLPDVSVMQGWSAGIWPYGLLLGIPLYLWAFKNRDDQLALVATPFLEPYFGPMSWMIILPKAMKNYWTTALATLVSWMIVLIWRFNLH
jgi:hypothetical protein